MTTRERYEAILSGREPDRIPWLPRLELWHRGHTARETLPEEFQGCSLREVERKLRLGTPARGARVFTQAYKNLDIRRRTEEPREMTEFITPHGKLRQVFSGSSLTHHLGYDRIWTEFPVKTADDLAAMEYVISHIEYEPCFDGYEEYENEVGGDGFPMVVAGLDPFHHVLLELTGYETGYVLMHTERQRFDHLVQVLTEKMDEHDSLIRESPGKLFCIGQHFDAQMTPPPVFAKYMLPYYQRLSESLHSSGKKLAFHADADCTGLLELTKEAGFDMAECFTCAPMVQCTLEAARSIWGEKVIIFGGIPSTIITESVSEKTFHSYVDDLFKIIAPGKAIILGIGDNVMPETIWDRFLHLTRTIEERGTYPVGG